MSVNGINGSYSSYVDTAASSRSTAAAKQSAEKATQDKTSSTDKNQAAVYEPAKTSTYKTNTKQQNQAIVNQLKADLENRKSQLTDMVTKMLNKQTHTWQNSKGGIDIYSVLRSGNLQVDAKTAAQAKADIADDGYWGVEQTSDRILSFAKALTGGDTEQADKMLNAFKKGFQQATGAWGDKLPDISQRTYDATLKKFEAWKNGTEQQA